MGDAVVNQNVDALPAAKAAVLRTLEKHNDALARLKEDYYRQRQRIQDDLRSTQRQWNAMAPISRLPSELLSMVFEEHCEFHIDGFYIWRSPDYARAIILHVCHHWRNVAFGNPRLWARIELRCKPLVDLALAHSGSLPLKVFNRQYTSIQGLQQLRTDPIIQSLFPEFRRLRLAQFRMTKSVASTFLVAYKEGVRLEAPILETLTLSMDVGALGTWFPLLSEMDLPSLTSLTVRNGGHVLVKSLLRHTLTTLEIYSSPDSNPSWLAEALVGLPLLQRLALSAVGEENIDSPLAPPWCRTIPLPHLKYLSLKGGIHSFDIVHLMECLDFPLDTEITLTMLTDQDALIVEQYKRVFPRVMSKALVSNMPARPEATRTVIPRVIDVTPSETCCTALDIALWPTLDLRGWESSPEIAPTAQKLRLIIATHMDSAAIVHFFDLVDLSEVVLLDLGDDFPAKVWMRAFRNRALPKLQRLIIRTLPTILEVLEAISTPLPTIAQESPASSQSAASNKSCSYLFPALKTLTLHRCEFRGKPGKILQGDCFPKIIRALRARAKHGYKLEKLRTTHSINLTREEDIGALSDPRIADAVEFGSGYEENCIDDENDIEQRGIVSDNDDDEGATS